MPRLPHRAEDEQGSAGATPDVVAVSNKLPHAIGAGCKGGGNVDSGEMAGTKASSQNTSWRRSTPGKRSVSGALLAMSQMASFMTDIGRTLRCHSSCSMAAVSRAGAILVRTALTASSRGGASLAGMYEPTNFYPFSRDGNEELAAKHVITGLSAWLSKSRPKSPDRLVDDEVVLAIPKIVHPQYKHMGERRQNMPCFKVKKIFASLVSRRVQGNQGQEGRRQACRTSAPKIQRGCQSIVKNRMVQVTLD